MKRTHSQRSRLVSISENMFFAACTSNEKDKLIATINYSGHYCRLRENTSLAYELLSKLLVSPLISPIVVPYMIPL